MRHFRTLAFASVSLAAIAMPAYAQDAAADERKGDEQIVVTGTLIRGSGPGSSQSLAITADDAKATGAATTAQLVATMPQSGFFATLPVVLGNNSYQKSANRPTLRNLDGGNNGSNPTLLLLDGHRLPGMGVISNSPDLDAIPAGALQRIDIVPDGGSAIYGADAVGGVINMITRTKADGIDLGARYGFANNYYTTDINATVGNTWGDVSAYVSYNFAKHDSLAGRDRGFVQRVEWANAVPGVLLDTNCTPANIRIGAQTFSSPTSAPGLGNRCDRSDDQTFYPAETRHSVLGSLTFDNGGAFSFNVKGWYTNRKNQGLGQPLAGSINLASSNPFYAPVSALAPATPTETVLFNFGSIVPATQFAELDTWGITPSLTYKFGGGWQVNALINFGQGKTRINNQAINTGLFTSLAAAGTFNPFNLGAASNAAALASLRDFYVYGESINKLTNGRIVADGPLFTMPGGDVKVAIGAEFTHEQFDLKFSPSAGATSAFRAAAPFPHASRSTQSVFGELSVPLIGNTNGGIRSLTLSLAGRYDHYSDVGNTFNPKVGLIFEPVEGVKFRGNWGRSFQSPGLADTAIAQPASITDFGAIGLGVRFANSAVAPTVGQTQLAIGGGGAALRPQKAETWSFGIDLKPAIIPDLSVSLTYYHVSFKDRIGIPSIFASDFYTSYPSGTPASGGFYVQGTAASPLTEAQIVAAGAAGGPTGPASVAPYIGANYVPGKVYNILYSGKANLNAVKTSGLDYSVRYDHQTSFGSVFLNFSGTYVITRDEQATALSPALNRNGIDFPKYRGTFTLGTNVGNLLAQATLMHSGSYNVVPIASALNQASIDAFNSLGLFFKYDFKGDGMSKDLSLTLNVDNMFDQSPPLYRGTFSSNSDGYGIGTSIGRLVTFGINKKF